MMEQLFTATGEAKGNGRRGKTKQPLFTASAEPFDLF